MERREEEKPHFVLCYLFKIEKCSGTFIRFHSNVGLIKKSGFVSHVVSILILSLLFAS